MILLLDIPEIVFPLFLYFKRKTAPRREYVPGRAPEVRPKIQNLASERSSPNMRVEHHLPGLSVAKIQRKTKKQPDPLSLRLPFLESFLDVMKRATAIGDSCSQIFSWIASR